MKKTFAILLCALMMISSAANAAAVTTSVIFDAENEDVLISGNAASGEVIITVTESADSAALSATHHPFDIISLTSVGGKYNTVLELAGTSAAGKKLKVTAFDSVGSDASAEFVNPDFAVASGLMSALASAQSASAFASVAEPKAAVLGFDTGTEIYKKSKSEIYSILYAILPDSPTPPKVYNLYYTACALASFGGASQAEVEKILSDNAPYIGINYTADYASDSRLDASAKTALCTILASENFGSALTSAEPFAVYLEKAKALARIKTADNWQDIKKVMDTDFKALFSLSNVSAAAAQSAYGKMMGYQYNKFSDISENYSLAIAAAKKEFEDDYKSSNRGGSSGGSSISLPPSVDIQIDTNAGEAAANVKTPMVTLPDNASSSFRDVPEAHWSYEAVSSLSTAGIISGYDAITFMPSNNITRAEFTKLVCASFGIPLSKASFADVPEDAWYNGYVGGAGEYGIVGGYGDTFGPNDCITRQDAAVIVYRALKNEDIILNGTADFADSLDISIYALTAVGAFKEYGILSGDGTNFRPLANITRAEAAQLLYKALSVGKN